MRKEYTQENEDADPSKEQDPVIRRWYLSERPVKEKVNKNEGAPATGLEEPVFFIPESHLRKFTHNQGGQAPFYVPMADKSGKWGRESLKPF